MTSATLHPDVSRETRRSETTRLLSEAAAASGAERDHLIDQVILINTRVARAIAKRYDGRGIPLEDLEQVAYVALVRAARNFDGRLAEDFLTYAVPTIRGEVKRHFRDHGWTVRPPRRVQELQSRVLQVRDAFRDASGEPPTAAAIAAELGVDVADVEEALSAEGCFHPQSLDAPTGAAGDGVNLGELLPTQEAGLDAAEARVVLGPALAGLTDRERLIIRLRFVEDLTQAEIGERIGVTQMQVSRLLKSVIAKLRAALEAPGSRSGHAA